MNFNQDIILQVGYNTLKYQELETNIKKLIKQTSQGFVVDFRQPEMGIALRENTVSLNKITLGNLFAKLDEAKQAHIMPNEQPEPQTLNMSYHIPPFAADEQDKWASELEQIVAARNRLIHHFEEYYAHYQDVDLLIILQQEFAQAEQFNMQILQRLNEVTVQGLHSMIRGLEVYRANWVLVSAAVAFEQVWAACVRLDGWAVWTLILAKMREQHSEALQQLQEAYPNENITQIVKQCYPNWRFSQETTDKGGVRVLVQVDNSEMNLQTADS